MSATRCQGHGRSNAAALRTANVRLVFAPDLARPEKRAAIDAARTFSRFGVTVDHVDADPSLMTERPSLQTVQRRLIHETRRGEEINEIVTAGTDFGYEDILDLFMARPKWEDIWKNRTSIGMGVTPHAISGWISQLDAHVAYPGIARCGVAGVASTSFLYTNLDLSARMKLATIRAVMKHELGHLLGRKGHCENAGCIMQNRPVNSFFIERVVKPGLDFCKKCEKEIRRWVSSGQAPGD